MDQVQELAPEAASGLSLSRRIKAPALHAVVSAVVAALAAALVFIAWYPPPYSRLAGGLSLFLILVGVDLVVGPVLTAVASDPAKPRRVFLRDLAVILLVQIAALGYGLYTLAQARPVILSFEFDRFRVLTASDIEPALLAEAPAGLRELSWTGPKLVAIAKPANRADFQRSLDLALGGYDVSYIPKSWRDYSVSAGEVWSGAQPLGALLNRYPDQANAVQKMARDAKRPLSDLGFVPVLSRTASGTAVIARPDSRIVGFLDVDGFL